LSTHETRAASGLRAVVVGAGAFGGWTALELVRRGARVTLVDAWGPGHVRASSGGETRIIRAVYGARAIYTRMAQRALGLWREHDARHGTSFFRQTGGLWMFGADDGFVRASAAALAEAGVPFEWLDRAEIGRRFPQIEPGDLGGALWEPEAGYLLARRACEHVAACVVAEGGEFRQAEVVRSTDPRELSRGVEFSGGSRMDADVVVYACGPWLGTLFPEVIGDLVIPTRQEVYYFGTPPGDSRFDDPQLPVWLDVGDRLIYGIPGNAHRGFKIADDTSGPRIDPTIASRELTLEGIETARAYLARRFPALASAPFLGGEVCQYEATPDSHFVIDRHPAAANVWIAGGGSGHGFKMGPVIGEILADAATGRGGRGVVGDVGRWGTSGNRGVGDVEKWGTSGNPGVGDVGQWGT
jgi:monomeric sarcosine oxidase